MTQAQIVSYDFGRHNADPGAAGRILESSSWKQLNTVWIIPAGKMVPAKAALSWMNLILPPNNSHYRMLTQNMEVGEAYSEAITQVLAHPDLSKWKYILTVEHDNIPPPDGFVKLLAQMEKHPEYACIGGLYWTKGESGVPQIWGDPKDPVLNFRPQPPRAGELVECCGTGMGFNVWRIDMFKDERLRKPWFRTLDGSEGTGVGTQDLHFWGDARKHGYRCAIDCDVLVGHLDSATDITW